MKPFQLRSFPASSPAGPHQLFCKDWGDAANPRVLLCLHGLVRCADDFDFLAQQLRPRWRIICPDLAGRGRSDRLADPRHYQVSQYVDDLRGLLNHLQLSRVAILGTSLGGIVGMALAALPEITVERLILNDVSPQLHAVGMRALGQHLAQALKFASFAEGAAYVRKISGGLGPHSDTQWDTLARNALRQNSTGSWEFHYDPALSVPLLASTEQSASQGEQDLWRLYDALAASATLRILLLRGQESALLSKDVAAAMLTRGPRTTLIEVAGVGHAPSLLHQDQVALVREFLGTALA
ncbi:alpha/beta fold hydrolase [Herbaspirillum autotrophicum]|uniref:alpha/beta fold hydrolase n=1 Tax=Herbaspirillum autotrophicum TaxID=180195 RepID=UPI0009F9F505|nr:alpha/beta hydrolase [Herbaspirillum autotrophicum]